MKFITIAAIAACAFFYNPLVVEAQTINLTAILNINDTLQSVVLAIDGVIHSVTSTIPVVSTLLGVLLVRVSGVFVINVAKIKLYTSKYFIFRPSSKPW